MILDLILFREANTIVQFTSSGSGMRCKGLDVGLTGVLLELTDFDGTEAFNIPLNWFREFFNIGDVTRVAYGEDQMIS